MDRCNTCGIRLDDGLCHCPTVWGPAVDALRARVAELEAELDYLLQPPPTLDAALTRLAEAASNVRRAALRGKDGAE